jgi:hypothetical protein
MEVKSITLPKTKSLILEYSLLISAFLIPTIISGPQILTGTMVNTLLFLFVMQLNSKRILPIIILPSIGAVLNGILFGKFTIFLLYFLPFIWIGNYLLVHTFRSFSKKYSFIASMVVSSVFKCIFLFIVAYIFISIKVVPMLFLQLMGLFQLYTALLGGLLALLIQKIIANKND